MKKIVAKKPLTKAQAQKIIDNMKKQERKEEIKKMAFDNIFLKQNPIHEEPVTLQEKLAIVEANRGRYQAELKQKKAENIMYWSLSITLALILGIAIAYSF